jgi:hypothetical protein
MGIFRDIVWFTGTKNNSDFRIFPGLTSERLLRITPAVFVSIIIAVFILPLVIPVAALDWTNETVDSSGDTGWYTSLDLDNVKRPHIS